MVDLLNLVKFVPLESCSLVLPELSFRRTSFRSSEFRCLRISVSPS